MTVDYGNRNHAAGLNTEGSVTPDHLYDHFTVTKKVIVASGQGALARGTAIGKITATGKWVKSLAAASDGSQVIRAITLHNVDATSQDAEVIAGRIGRCNGAAVILGAGHTLASIDDACLDRGIIFESIIG